LGNKNVEQPQDPDAIAEYNRKRGVYSGLNLKVCIGKRYVEQYLLNGSKEPPIQIHTGDYSTSTYTEWEGMGFVPGDTEATGTMKKYNSDWRNTADGYKKLTDDFRIDFNDDTGSNNNPAGYYMNKNSEYISKQNYSE
jgi:hypothetical protein